MTKVLLSAAISTAISVVGCQQGGQLSGTNENVQKQNTIAASAMNANSNSLNMAPANIAPQGRVTWRERRPANKADNNIR